MKIRALIILMLLGSAHAMGARNDSSFIFNEFCLSVNRSNVRDDNAGNRVGFGFGIYRCFLSEKTVNIITGLEFNLTSLFRNKLYESHFSQATDVSIHISSLSLPLSARVNFGRKLKIFIEAGAFLDLNVGAYEKGIMHTYAPDFNNTILYTESKFHRKTQVNSLNYGPCVGAGLKVPFLKHEMLIKADFKAWLHPSNGFRFVSTFQYFRVIIGYRI